MASHELIDLGYPRDDGRMSLWASIADYPDWVVWADLLESQGVIGVAELRVFPRQETFVYVQAGEVVETSGPTGAEHWTGRSDDVPAGGVPARLLRRINVGELVDLARKEAAKRSRETNERAEWYASASDPDFAAYLRTMAKRNKAVAKGNVRRSGRRGNGIDHYLMWAVRYADKVASGSRRPHEELAEKHDESVNYVRDTVLDARRRYGLLTTPPRRGVPGGELTQKARDLIAERQKKGN